MVVTQRCPGAIVPLPLEGRAIAYGAVPPPLFPPLKGEGDADAAFSFKIVCVGVSWQCPEVPLPLEGRG